MRFDKFDRTFADTLKDDAEPALAPVADGVHDFEIKKVKWIEKVGKVVIELATASGSFQWIGLWLNPTEQKDHDKAMALLNALGLSEDTDIDDSLVGRFVALKTAQAVKNGQPVFENDGRRRIYINGISQSKLEVPTSKPAPRPQTPAAKVAAARGDEAGGEDDIPFMWMLPFALAVASMGGLA
jgi:hypothetical protein